jgi:hypothetical protein
MVFTMDGLTTMGDIPYSSYFDSGLRIYDANDRLSIDGSRRQSLILTRFI